MSTRGRARMGQKRLSAVEPIGRHGPERHGSKKNPEALDLEEQRRLRRVEREIAEWVNLVGEDLAVHIMKRVYSLF